MLRIGLQIGAQVVLARLLGPDQYGVFAIGATVVSLSGFFSDVGLAYGLIQKQNINERDIRFVFTWQLVLGLAVAAAVWMSADWIARFFDEPRSSEVLKVLASICLLNALAAPSLNLLKREIDFKTINIVQLISYGVGYIFIGIPLALAGVGVWALAAAWVVQATLALILFYGSSRHAISPLIWYEEARHQSRYGGIVFVTNLVNWLIGNIDRIVVGRVFGSHEIGLYATSYNLLYTPAAAALGVVQPVFFSASARVQDDTPRIVTGYLALLSAVTVFACPIFSLVATAPEAFIGMIYGPKWLPAAILCQPIALAMPFFLIWGFSTPMLWTGGKAEREFWVQLPLAIFWIAACVLASRHSVQALAWCVLALAAIRSIVVVIAASRTVQLPWISIWAALRGGLILSINILIAVSIVKPMLDSYSHGLKFMILLIMVVIVWVAVLKLFPTLIGKELAYYLRQLLLRLPLRLRITLAFLTRGSSK